MYIYNITINVEEEIHDQWLRWMKEEYIPATLQTGKFSKALMTRVMIEEELGGITYSIQFTTQSRELLDRYYKEDARRLRDEGLRFQGHYAAFSTELEVVGEYD